MLGDDDPVIRFQFAFDDFGERVVVKTGGDLNGDRLVVAPWTSNREAPAKIEEFAARAATVLG